MKRIITILLALCLALSPVLSTNVYAASKKTSKVSDKKSAEDEAAEYIEQGLECLLDPELFGDAYEMFAKADELGDPDGSFLAGYTLQVIQGSVGGFFDEDIAEYYEKCADDNPFACSCLAILLANNSRPLYDPDAADEYAVAALDMLSDLDDIPEKMDFVCYNALGLLFSNEALGYIDYETAVECYMEAADKGYAPAIFNVGYMYENGYGVDMDYEEAMNYYQEAADLEFSNAYYEIASMYESGCGVDVDEEMAFENYAEAADCGSADALAVVGAFYDYGIGVEQDEEQAYEIYAAAAEAGSQFGMRCAAYDLFYGVGVEQDEEAAIEMYEDTADTGDYISMYCLGLIYDDGYFGDEDPETAMYWYQLAAERGYADAMYSVGCNYANGCGVDEDYDEAFYWYQLAADAGNVNAMNSVGYMYENGLSVDEDFDMAMEYFLKAADLGNPTAMENIAIMYENGYGVKKNQKKADEWYEKAEKASADEAEEETEDDELDNELDKKEVFAYSMAENHEGFTIENFKNGVFITVDSSYELESDAWVGIVPSGKKFKNGGEAASNDILYTYVENFDERDDDDGYYFSFATEYVEDVEDGTYDMVLCNNDMKDGKVLLQFSINKSGSKINIAE